MSSVVIIDCKVIVYYFKKVCWWKLLYEVISSCSFVVVLESRDKLCCLGKQILYIYHIE